MSLTQPLKIHGGKHDLAKWIVSLMPPRCTNPNDPDPSDNGWLHYVEPYFGGGSVLLELNPHGISEVVNDLNGSLINFWKVLADDGAFEDFKRKADCTPFAQKLWEGSKGLAALNPDECDVSCAVAFFIRSRQSMSGRMTNFPPMVKKRTRRGMQDHVSAWLNAIDGLPAVHARLKRVAILDQPALDVIRSQDGPRTLFYLDPPYLHETRSTTGEYGAFEMTPQDHENLLKLLGGIDGRFLLSGYRSALYDRYADALGWKRHEKKINNHASSKKVKDIKTECIWCNY